MASPFGTFGAPSNPTPKMTSFASFRTLSNPTLERLNDPNALPFSGKQQQQKDEIHNSEEASKRASHQNAERHLEFSYQAEARRLEEAHKNHERHLEETHLTALSHTIQSNAQKLQHDRHQTLLSLHKTRNEIKMMKKAAKSRLKDMEEANFNKIINCDKEVDAKIANADRESRARIEMVELWVRAKMAGEERLTGVEEEKRRKSGREGDGEVESSLDVENEETSADTDTAMRDENDMTDGKPATELEKQTRSEETAENSTLWQDYVIKHTGESMLEVERNMTKIRAAETE